MKTISYNNASLNRVKNILLFSILQLVITILLLLFSASVINAQHLVIENGTALKFSNNLVIGGHLDLENNGNLFGRQGSKITFKGTHKQQIKGSGSFTFVNMEINNSSIGVELLRNITIYGQLLLTDGDFDLRDQDLNLATNASISGEHISSRVISSTGSGGYNQGQDAGDGSVIKTIDISTSGVTNAGGLGISITPTANFGSTKITRKHQRVVGVSGDNSVFRTYTISPTNSSNLEAQIVFKYNSSNELNGNSSGFLKLYQRKNAGSKGFEWEELSSSDNGNDVSATTNDNTLSDIVVTAAGTSKTFPVALLSFSAICNQNVTLINWQTASETNNNYFIIERSIDGINFEELGKIQGAGNSNVLKNYEFIDAINSNSIVFYRLTQVDFDGKYTVFDIVSSDCSNSQLASFKYVNPVNNKKLTIISSQIIKDNITLYIYSNTGQCIITKKLANGVNVWNINVDILSQGVYHVVLQNQAILESKSVIIL